MSSKTHLILVSLLLDLATAPVFAADDFQVVVNAAVPVTELERAELARFFLRQSGKWNDGMPVLPIDQSARSQVRVAFSQGVLRQPLPAVENYWRLQISGGRAVPPPVKTSDAEVLAFVAANPGAVGYVSGAFSLTPGVKALRVRE
jgi:ABC-type phosphate transport system substrate-binding protein